MGHHTVAYVLATRGCIEKISVTRKSPNHILIPIPIKTSQLGEQVLILDHDQKVTRARQKTPQKSDKEKTMTFCDYEILCPCMDFDFEPSKLLFSFTQRIIRKIDMF